VFTELHHRVAGCDFFTAEDYTVIGLYELSR